MKGINGQCGLMEINIGILANTNIGISAYRQNWHIGTPLPCSTTLKAPAEDPIGI